MKINKKKISYLVFSIISASTILYTFFSIISINKNFKNNLPIKEKKDYKYLVKEDCGKIKIFENGNNEAIDTLEKEVEYLPEYDQNMLKEGIYVYNASDLNRILEDYDD